jgi:hypothetical protein
MIFSKIVKKLQLPSVYSEAAFEVLNSQGIKLGAASPTSLQPGDIATFSYGGGLLAGSRRFLIVGTDAHASGKYLSGKGNYLICGYDLTNRETFPGMVMVFNSFYKKTNSNYARMKGIMSSIFGESFKTFKASGMKSLYKIEVVR